MKIVIVHINPAGDGVTAMYIDGKLRIEGDYYHDKIDHWIDGYLEGLTEGMNDEVPEIAHVNITDDKQITKYCESGSPLPKFLTKLEKHFDA